MISLLGLMRIKSSFFIINVVKKAEKQQFSAFFFKGNKKFKKKNFSFKKKQKFQEKEKKIGFFC